MAKRRGAIGVAETFPSWIPVPQSLNTEARSKRNNESVGPAQPVRKDHSDNALKGGPRRFLPCDTDVLAPFEVTMR